MWAKSAVGGMPKAGRVEGLRQGQVLIMQVLSKREVLALGMGKLGPHAKGVKKPSGLPGPERARDAEPRSRFSL